jgi:hypothetical protein
MLNRSVKLYIAKYVVVGRWDGSCTVVPVFPGNLTRKVPTA